MIPHRQKIWPYIIVQLLVSVCIINASYKDDHDLYNRPKQADQHIETSESKQRGLFDDFAYTATIDESKLRLALLVDEKIDRNKDGSVQLDELVGWLRECQDKYAKEDVNRHWHIYKKPLDDHSAIGWKEFAEREYDHLVTLTKQSGDQDQVDRVKKSHQFHIQRDMRRWRKADSNNDGRLNRVEFKTFLYPEGSEVMHDVLVDEKLEFLDKDQDGKISATEFLSDLTPEAAHYDDSKHEEWLQSERSKFHSQIDKNHDEYLDRTELSLWMSSLRASHDNTVTEAQHLMQASDRNRDHRLTKEEILASYHEFVNSHATDFGEALRSQKQPSHDEL